jgi:hypothetical protein
LSARPIHKVLTRQKDRVTKSFEMWLVQVTIENTVVIEEQTPAIKFTSFSLFLG